MLHVGLALSLALLPAPQAQRTLDRLPPNYGPLDRGSAAFVPYDFTAARELLDDELPDLNGRVAVIVRQGGQDLFRYQAGEIGYDTRTRLASFTKTISAGVVLALADEGQLSLSERIGDAFPLFEANGLGDPTVLDCWAMRHGIETPLEYHRDPSLTLLQSVFWIGTTGTLLFEPETRLGYDGCGMQLVGALCTQRTGLTWYDTARTRIFDRCAMPNADYEQFAPNPAVAGGLRSSATETIEYAQMILDEGIYAGEPVLSQASIDVLFTNYTRGLPVEHSPFPETHPDYPYGTDPDYAFGSWVLAEDPATQHVEELCGAGAWGSFLWIDRRRGLTATLITDITPGTQRSMDAALGLFAIARAEVESVQASDLAVRRGPVTPVLEWTPAAPSTATRIYGASTPIRDLFDLRRAELLGQTSASSAAVPAYAYYAVTATFGAFENTSLTAGVNVSAP